MKKSKAAAEIELMFNKIAKSYDFLNNLISAFSHIFIKKSSVEFLGIQDGSSVLDLCTGSGDLAGIIKKKYPKCQVIGADFSDEMLKIAKKKGFDIEYLKEDATNLSFDDETFDYVVMGFGLRNIPDKQAALSEVVRVLSPGGKFLHLDFGEKNLISNFADIFILAVARIFSKNFNAYKYLVESKKGFLSPHELISKAENCSLKFLRRKDFLFKTVTCEVFEK